MEQGNGQILLRYILCLYEIAIMKFSAMDNYGGLMRTVFIGPVLQDLGISWQTCLEKFGKYGLVGRDVSLGIGVEVPKACTTPIYLSATAPVLCLSGVMLPTQSS